MTVKDTLQIGDPLLKAKNKVVIDFKKRVIKKVINDLIDTMKSRELIGIAAPQIGYNYKIFVTQPRKTKARAFSFKDKIRVYINPEIAKLSNKKVIIWEGCGCVGQKDMFFGPVKRSKEVSLIAYDENGKKFRIRCDGILARVILHEMDHLNGVEFIEKVEDYKKLMHQKHYIEKIKNSPGQLSASKVDLLEYKLLG